MLKSGSGRMHLSHKTTLGFHSATCPTENRRTKPFWNKPPLTRSTGPARFADQSGNQMLDPESVHRTPPDKGLLPVKHHQPHTKPQNQANPPTPLNRSAPENQPAARTKSGIRCQYPIQSANNTSPARTHLPPPHPSDYPNSNQYKPGIYCVCRVGIC